MQKSIPWVVIAWTDDNLQWDGQPFAADLGQQAKLIADTTAHAVVWKRHATPEDVEKAHRFVRAQYPETGRVYQYSAEVRDPLARAKLDIGTGQPSS